MAGLARKSPKGTDGALRSNVTRTRTGCLTCRKRRKKCDERKPMCKNCEKTNLVCEGFPQRMRWQQAKDAKDAKDAGTAQAPVSNSVGFLPAAFSGVTGEDIPGFGYDMSQDGNSTFFNQASSARFGQDYGSVGNFDDGLDTIFTPLGLPQAPTIPQTGFSSTVFLGGYQNVPRSSILNGSVRTDSKEIEQSHDLPKEAFMPRELPFLIPGIDSAIQKRLFCHFTGVMSHLLTASSGESNPMNVVVIPLALGDRTVMDSVLCLSGSHLLKLQNTCADQALKAERARLHDGALQMQVQRTRDLLESTAGCRQIYSMRDQEIIFATSLLLCLYEICEGTGDDAWRMHLDMARQVITILSKTPDENHSVSAAESIITEINPFLVEFFIYHDSLATVTIPSLQAKQHYIHKTAANPEHDASMVGVQDGLVDFITRIASLRTEADASKDQLDGDVVSKAVLIWQDLDNWKPKTTFSKDHKLVAEFYQWSLFIWLFSIINPDSKSDAKIQDAVQRIATGMNEIKDGVRACLLFPLFVVGSAAITAEDRAAITAQFQRLRAWSSLGNIDLTYSVVEKMWVDHDDGMPRSWDWVRQLERHGMSLLVT